MISKNTKKKKTRFGQLFSIHLPVFSYLQKRKQKIKAKKSQKLKKIEKEQKQGKTKML